MGTKTMPEKITLEDGTEREILTDEEVKDLQAGHDANKDKKPIVEQFNKVIESLDLKEGEKLDDKIQELQDSENPNWKKMRDTLKTLKDAAKEKDIDIDDNGNIVEKKEGLTKEEIIELTKKEISSGQKQVQKDKILSGLSKEDAETVGAVFDKLDVLGGSFDENIKLAISKVLPDQSEGLLKQAINSSGGAQPKQAKADEPSSDLKSFGASNFGLSEDDFKNINN